MATPADDKAMPLEELVALVRARVLKSASADEIRSLAAEAAERARGNPVTHAEARRLGEVALDRAQQVAGLMGRLAELMGEAGEGRNAKP